MADDVTVDNGGLTDYVVATDDIGSGRQAQLMKLLYSANGDATAIGADANGLDVDVTRLPALVAGTAVIGSIIARVDQLRIPVTPTIDTAVYAAGDRLGSVMTFAGSAISNGRTGSVVSAYLTDKANSLFDIDLGLFQVTPTLVNADNGVFDMTDANKDTAVPLGWINFSTANSYAYGTSNRDVQGTYLGGPCDLRYTCAAGDTALYGVLVARGAYDAAATSDLICTITVVRD